MTREEIIALLDKIRRMSSSRNKGDDSARLYFINELAEDAWRTMKYMEGESNG